MSTWETKSILASLILIIGVADDLRSRKVHNSLILIFAGVSLISIPILSSWAGYAVAASSLLTAAVLSLPLFMFRMLGGGDVKLFLVFSLLVSWQAVIATLLLSILWGGVLGVMQIILKGQIKDLLLNCWSLITRKSRSSELQLHKIPYTVALLFGWLSHLTYAGLGRSFL